jgi:type II secretory pathway component GspD/PulD (secretin)
VVIFRDYPPVLAELERSLAALDVPQQQVEIEVQFVEARTNDLRQLGVEWSTQVAVGVGGADLDQGSSSTDPSTEGERSFSFQSDLNTGAYAWGTLGVSEVSAVIHYLVENNRGKILSQPKVSVMDNETAEIRVTTTNPVQTVNRFSEGAVIQDVVTYQYIETGIKLLVRPRVSDDGYVSLSVNPIFEEILALVGPTDSPAPVTAKREVTTTVKVPNGQTLVLGGLTREREIESESKVWLLGDLPLLGALFRSTRKENEQTELMIMITPRVLPQS